MGTGIGNSRQKYLFLPEPQNDFIFAIVCEELGFIGATLILLLFALLIWRGFVIGVRARDRFGSFIALGLTAQLHCRCCSTSLWQPTVSRIPASVCRSSPTEEPR